MGKVAKRPTTRVGIKKKKAESDRKAFLEALRTCGGNVFRAAKTACIHEDMPYKWRRKNEEFAIAMEEARSQGEELLAYELLEEARRRGLEGTLEPHFYQGREVGHIRRYSDNLLMFKIKGLMPKFRDNFPAIDIHASGPSSIRIFLDETPTSSLPANDGGPQPEAIEMTPEGESGEDS